jgi:nitrile hydratase beta subunit
MTVRPQDLGGRKGFGAVPIEDNEPVFHGQWEGRVIAGILATIGAGVYNVDQFRELIDELEPLSYVRVGYYGRWLHTLEANCIRSGVFTAEEIERRMEELASGEPRPAVSDPAIAEGLRVLIRDGAPNGREVDRAPAYAVGDRVQGRVLADVRHARIPGYAQGRSGVVERVHPAFPQPDANRVGAGERPEHVYAVRFAARELWPDADPGASIVVDLWESYLDPESEAEQ